MKKILGLILLIISINLFGQTPPGYQTRIVRERIQGSSMTDSTQHVPRYCGTPSGVRGGGSTQDGAIAIDTCNNLLYIYSGGTWRTVSGSDTTYTFKNTLYNEGVVVYYDNFSRSYLGSNYYSTLPATTATIDANGLNLSGGADNLLNYVQRNFNTSAANFELTLTYINNAISTTDSGVWIGVKSNNTNCCQHDIMVGVYQATGHPNLGKSFIFGRGYTYTHVGSDAISSISVGDTIQVTMKRSDLTYIVNSRNITTGETSTDTVVTTIGTTPTNFYPNNNSKPTIYFRSGDITIIGEEYRLLDTWNAAYAFVGNSITQGEAASAYNLTYPNRTFESDSGISVITLAGGGDITQSIIDELPEIYKLKPRYVVLMIGGNDLLFAISTSTWQNNLVKIRDSLTAHGIEVIHAAETPRQGVNLTPLRDFIDTTVRFGSDLKILSTFDSLLLPTTTQMKPVYEAVDGIHLTDSGHHYVAIKIREAITPHPRTPIPIIPLQSLYADGYELPNAVLTNHGWDTTLFNRVISSGGGSGTPAGNFGNVQLNRSGSFATPASDSLGYTTSAGLNVKNQIQATGGLITNETLNSGYSTLIHEDLLTISTLPNASLRIGNPSTTPGSFSSFGIAPAYSGATSPTVFYISNFPNYTSGSRQFMIYQSASGDDIIMSTSNGFGGQNKKNYHFNTTLYNGSTNASLSLLSSGNVGVNQVAPDSTFQVNGGLKFVTGRQGAGKVLTSDANGGADWATPKGLTQSKAVTIESPSSSEAVDMWQTPVAITVSSLKAILRGSSPSVTYNIKFGTDITSPTSVFTSDITCTSITTGCSNSSGFNDATIPAGSFIWVVTTASSGTITSISLTINYTED